MNTVNSRKKGKFFFIHRNMYLHNDKEVHMKSHHIPYSYANKNLFSQYSLTAKDEAKDVISMKTVSENVVVCRVL